MKHRVAWIAGAVAVLAIATLGTLCVGRANEFEALAKAGKADVTAGLKSLTAKQPTLALDSFERAKDEFGSARDLLGPDWLAGIPLLGRQLRVANDLVTIGYEGSSAGTSAVRLLNQAASVSTAGLTELIQQAHPDLDASLASLASVADHADDLTPEGLVPQLAAAVTEMQDKLRPMQPLLDRSGSLLELERYIFSGQHRFLVVSQNSAELRPTGGFMGTYGLVEFGPDGFQLAKYADIYTLPHDTLNLPIPPGGQVNYHHFWFRNTNWWMDFPTSANLMMRFWQNLQQPQIDGIVAIDIPTIRDLLKIFGPIKVPESAQPLTAANVMQQLTYVVEYEMGRAGPNKKNALVSLSEALVDRVTHLGSDQFLPTMEALATSADEKHIQTFFTDPRAQAAIVSVGWAGAIAPPAATTDVLAIANGVIKPSKANLGVTKTLNYRVALAADGSADTSLQLGYHKSPQELLGVPQQWLANYVRVHRAAGTTLLPGASAVDPLDDASGLPTFGHYFRLDPGRSTTVTMNFKVPQAASPGTAAGAPADTAVPVDSWHYELLLVKQADLVDTTATVTVQAPAGWKLTSSAANWRVSGGSVPTSLGQSTVTLEAPLKQDMILDVTLTRA